ncbi:MAG: 2-hydroxyacid dehydrogenase [Alphaproteobacteria bacterium]|nr:2-hydroxyacid dehydrogenase [Alphaproteobacteria bacterium]
MKHEILMSGKMYAKTMEVLDATYTTHKLWEAPDQKKKLAELAPRIRAAAAGSGKFDAAMMDALPNLKLIANFGVGVDSIDVKAATQRGIAVTNTPDVLTDEVADLAMGLVIAAARRMAFADRYVRDGSWVNKGSMPFTRRVHGKTLGILGLGRIGLAIAKRAEAFGMPILYNQRRKRSDANYRYVADLTEMAKLSDFLMVSCPGGPETARLVNEKVLRALGPDGIVVNIARGSVIDEPVMVRLLKEGAIGGAGLDVFADEPRVPAELLAMDHVVLQPHQGSATPETRTAMGQLVIDNLAAFFANKPLLTKVG